MQSAAYIMNLINNKIGSSNNDINNSFITMVAWLRAGAVQASRNNKYAATVIILPSTLHTTNIIKRARRQLAFMVPGIHSPVHIQATSSQTQNTLSAEYLQHITMLVMQVKSMAAATAKVAPTVEPFTFNGSDFFRMLGWCGPKPTQEILIPPVRNQLGTVQASRTKKYAAIAIIFPSTLHTTNIPKWARRQLSFMVPGIHSPVPIQATG